MGNVLFGVGEYYHIFNRGVDKRIIFSDKYDIYRFLQSLREFNSIEPGNDIFFANKKKKVGCPTANKNRKNLVSIVCYCLNHNHFHLIIEEIVDGGISEFMKRLGGGYANYYNKKYERNGSLFQGKFKAVHIESNEQLLYVGSYVNLNNKVHKKFDESVGNFIDLIPNRSSWNEYMGKEKYRLCDKGIILDQFKNRGEYKKFTEETIKIIKEMRYEN